MRRGDRNAKRRRDRRQSHLARVGHEDLHRCTDRTPQWRDLRLALAEREDVWLPCACASTARRTSWTTYRNSTVAANIVSKSSSTAPASAATTASDWPTASNRRWRLATARCTSSAPMTTCPSRAGRRSYIANTTPATPAAAASSRFRHTVFPSTARSAGVPSAKAWAHRSVPTRRRWSTTANSRCDKVHWLSGRPSARNWPPRCSTRCRRKRACRSMCRSMTSPHEHRRIVLHGLDDEWIDVRLEDSCRQCCRQRRDPHVPHPVQGHLPGTRRQRPDFRHRSARDWNISSTKSSAPSAVAAEIREDAAAVRLFDRSIDYLCRTPLGEACSTRSRRGSSPPAVARWPASWCARSTIDSSFSSTSVSNTSPWARTAPTLSGGEAQRIRLAAQLGSGLTGVLYVLDEPTIGLHPRDNRRLIDALAELRDLGNTLLVVEHDREVVTGADHLLDFGPGSGSGGGQIVARGTPAQLASRNDLGNRSLSLGPQGDPNPQQPPTVDHPTTIPRTQHSTDDVSKSSAPGITTSTTSTCRYRSAR